MNITVDQQAYYPYEPDQTAVEKEQSQRYDINEQGEPDNHSSNPDPFLLTDSKIMTGQGKAVIMAVGQNTLLARIMKGKNMSMEENPTHLEEKLKVTAASIEKFAKLVMALTIVTHLIFLVIYIPSTD